jgi:hypothetical protein
MSESNVVNACFITQIVVTDPDTRAPVEMEVWKDPTSDGLFAIDASFLDAIAEEIPSPFNPHIRLHLREDALPTLPAPG